MLGQLTQYVSTVTPSSRSIVNMRWMTLAVRDVWHLRFWMNAFNDISIGSDTNNNNDISSIQFTPVYTLELQYCSLSKAVMESELVCKKCFATFSLKKNLISHMKIQHGKTRPNFVCPISKCTTSFTTKYNLKEHIL